MSVPDHYITLEIECNASDEDIKQAFRRLAKRFHPDKNPGSEKSAEQSFKKITAAYEILGNRESRNVYDSTLQTYSTDTPDREWSDLRRKAKKDVAYLCRLMLLDLLNQNSQSALDIYEDLMSRKPSFSLDQYMSYGDIRDCEFLLAEAYHQRGKLTEAARLYEKVLEDEKKMAYFRRFAQEIRLMLKEVYTQYIAKAKSPEEISVSLNRIMELDLSNRETAWIHKKAAEAYYRTKDMDRAREALKRAFQINPKLTGAKKISIKLGRTKRLSVATFNR
jgi:curved DNA-binding protein CbpA